FGRAKGLSIHTASSAASMASLCDSTLAAAIRPNLEQALKAAEDAHYGSGQAEYWSQRTAKEAASVRSSLGSIAPGAAAPPTPGQESFLQKDLEQINRNLTNDVEKLVFG